MTQSKIQLTCGLSGWPLPHQWNSSISPCSDDHSGTMSFSPCLILLRLILLGKAQHLSKPPLPVCCFASRFRWIPSTVLYDSLGLGWTRVAQGESHMNATSPKSAYYRALHPTSISLCHFFNFNMGLQPTYGFPLTLYNTLHLINTTINFDFLTCISFELFFVTCNRLIDP